MDYVIETLVSVLKLLARQEIISKVDMNNSSFDIYLK
jgi:hypothetical protein